MLIASPIRRKSWLALCLYMLAAAAAQAQDFLPKPGDAVETNSSFDSAKRVELPVLSQHGCIDPASDIDFFVVHLERPGPLYAGVKGARVGQFKVALYDEHRALLGTGIDGVDLPRLPATDHYVTITSVQRGCYDLDIYSDAQPPPLP